jgi:hypothetical protein
VGKVLNACRVVVRKSEGKKSLLRPKRRWEDNIKVGLTEIGWKGIDWVNMARDSNNWQDAVETLLKCQVS